MKETLNPSQWEALTTLTIGEHLNSSTISQTDSGMKTVKAPPEPHKESPDIVEQSVNNVASNRN